MVLVTSFKLHHVKIGDIAYERCVASISADQFAIEVCSWYRNSSVKSMKKTNISTPNRLQLAWQSS